MLRIGALKIKAQLFCGDERAIGPGRADLLDAIDRHGSISAAGRALGMSYRYTWLLVDAMNRCFAERLVMTHAGGARLSDNGRRVLGAYRAVEAALVDAARAHGALAELEALMLPTPRLPGDGVAEGVAE